MIEKITQKRLKEVLHYNPDTGIFVWQIALSKNINVGGIAGTISHSYIRIQIDKKLYRAHRLAWLYVKGVWPKVDIDHKDTIKHHNWINNLREATKSENGQNRIKSNSNSKTGVLGITQIKSGKYRVQMHINGKQEFLGDFSTLKIAKGVRDRAKRKHHSTCTL
jgi:mRNA-degrading endonuclease RelE of RelBE toxin-antitoxin system